MTGQMGLALQAPQQVDRPPAITLRPYQQDAVNAVCHALDQGQSKLLIALPTGTGKTIVFSSLPHALGVAAAGQRTLVLAHREELLDQAAAKFSAVAPQLTVGIEQAARRCDSNTDVVIASVPTLQRARLEALNPDDFGLVVVDEAHHAVANTYRAIFDHLGAGEPGGPALIGVTATPNRGDKVGLGAVFSSIAYKMGIKRAIRDGWLCPVTGYAVEGGADLSGVKTRGGEFVTSALAEAINTPARNALAVRAYLDHTPGQRALAFTADVAHAHDLAQEFRRANVRAEALSGKTPTEERREILRWLAAGERDVVTNCAVLTEGFDEPRVSSIVMARPTKSQLLYTQMVGRGTRMAPGKKQLTVLDLVDNAGRHSLCSVASLLGLPPKLDLDGKDAQKVEAEIAELEKRCPWIDTAKLTSAKDIKATARRVDLLYAPAIPEPLAGATCFAWVPLPNGDYRLSLPEREELRITGTLIDTWQVDARSKIGASDLGEHASLEEATKVADQWVRHNRPEADRMLDMRAGWRSKPASDKQLAVLRRRGIQAPSPCSKGQASWLIDLSIGGHRARF